MIPAETPDFSQYPNTYSGNCYRYDPATGLRVPDLPAEPAPAPAPEPTPTPAPEPTPKPAPLKGK